MILSFRGPIGSGKSSIAKHLVDTQNFVRVSFADPLKVEVFNYLWTGVDEVFMQFLRDTDTPVQTEFPIPDKDFPTTDLYYISDTEKLAWVNANKVTLRPLLQWWGTEYRRAQDTDYWTKKAFERIVNLLQKGVDIVMDDCRFPNEIEAIQKLGGYHIYIDSDVALRTEWVLQRSGGKESAISGHASDALDNDVATCFTSIGNTGTLEHLFAKVDTLVNDLRFLQGYNARD